MAISTVHLESLNSKPMREQQLVSIGQLLSGFGNSSVRFIININTL